MNQQSTNKVLAIWALTIFFSWNGISVSQDNLLRKEAKKDSATKVHQGEMGFPEFQFPNVKGAPQLSRPFMVMGLSQPILTEKHGLAGPAFFDWNRDGKKDLLVGEFETGDDESNVRVYLNIGTKSEPRFSDKFQYAEDTENKVISVKQW